VAATVEDLTRDSFERLVRGSERPAVIDFWGPQCAPCLALAPAFHRLADEHGSRIDFLRVEAPKNRMLCVDLRVMSLPTFLYLEGGVEQGRLDGDISDERLAGWINGFTADQKGALKDV
jgi:thioredoxin 1